MESRLQCLCFSLSLMAIGTLSEGRTVVLCIFHVVRFNPHFLLCFVSCFLSPPKVCFPILSPFAKLVGPHRKSERRKGRRSILRKSPKETDVFSFAGNIIYKWWIFHCHVWLPEGKPRNEKTWWFSVGFLWDYIGLIGIIPALRCLVILPFNALWRWVEIQL